jgi:PP-loop superfamily ATP-utilizing enzyme
MEVQVVKMEAQVAQMTAQSAQITRELAEREAEHLQKESSLQESCKACVRAQQETVVELAEAKEAAAQHRSRVCTLQV